ncbi:Uncharacterised protein [BD1-7 clade bacterium]|uniref:Uncharacterized protein n=1 Tax=BD1-7 clade bacterium TaxID=2029982 RepID=A0A5S9QZJ8_9GAMM|nr:Uncharacterised protein [BD1-7 clade bacterium]
MTTITTADLPMVGEPTARHLSLPARNHFLIWTALWWGGVGVCAFLFFIGQLDFPTSTKISLYGISVWLNGWLLGLIGKQHRSKMDMYHDCLVLWMMSYAITNIMWEIPWVIFSPFVFENMHTLDDVVAHTGYMRESLLNMYWWILASFSSVDLRTVNHDPTFYTIELYAFINVASTIYFFHLNNKQSPYRYLIPVLGCGEPIAATFVFSFSEVFANFENMPGGVADTLLALVWTQYQYILFPLIFGYIGYQLLLDDWRKTHIKG